jgi:hypothetical protein
VWLQRDQTQREPRALTRSRCTTKLKVQCCKKTGIWFVKNYVDEHNHEFVKLEHSHILRSHRRLSVPQKAEAVELGLCGLRTSQIMDVMEKNHGGPEWTCIIFFVQTQEAKNRRQGCSECPKPYESDVGEGLQVFSSIAWTVRGGLKI